MNKARFPKIWLCMTTYTWKSRGADGQLISKPAHVEDYVEIADEPTAAMPVRDAERHEFMGDIVTFEHPAQIPRALVEIPVTGENGRQKIEKDDYGDWYPVWEMTDHLDGHGGRMSALRDNGVMYFKPITDEEAEKLSRLRLEDRVGVRLESDASPPQFCLPRHDEYGAPINGWSVRAQDMTTEQLMDPWTYLDEGPATDAELTPAAPAQHAAPDAAATPSGQPESETLSIKEIIEEAVKAGAAAGREAAAEAGAAAAREVIAEDRRVAKARSDNLKKGREAKQRKAAEAKAAQAAQTAEATPTDDAPAEE